MGKRIRSDRCQHGEQRLLRKTTQRKKWKWNKEKTIITYKAHNGQDLPLPRYYKTTIYTDDQRQLLWLYAEDKGVKWVKGFEVIGATTVNKDYYERLLKELMERGNDKRKHLCIHSYVEKRFTDEDASEWQLGIQ